MTTQIMMSHEATSSSSIAYSALDTEIRHININLTSENVQHSGSDRQRVNFTRALLLHRYGNSTSRLSFSEKYPTYTTHVLLSKAPNIPKIDWSNVDAQQNSPTEGMICLLNQICELGPVSLVLHRTDCEK